MWHILLLRRRWSCVLKGVKRNFEHVSGNMITNLIFEDCYFLGKKISMKFNISSSTPVYLLNQSDIIEISGVYINIFYSITSYWKFLTLTSSISSHKSHTFLNVCMLNFQLLQYSLREQMRKREKRKTHSDYYLNLNIRPRCFLFITIILWCFECIENISWGVAIKAWKWRKR